MDLSPTPDGLAAVTAGVLLMALLLSVLIVWRRRSAETPGVGPEALQWGGAQSWTAYAVTDVPAHDELPLVGWERTLARQQQVAGGWRNMAEPADHPEETEAIAHVPAPRSGDADRVDRPTPRPAPRPAPPADPQDRGMQGRGMQGRSAQDRNMQDRSVPDRDAQDWDVQARVPQGDLRDRLFAVVLGDYDTVLGGLDELAVCQQRLAQLSVATDRERSSLSAALSRLAATGLRPDQLSRLADIPLDEVRRLLGPVAADANS